MVELMTAVLVLLGDYLLEKLVEASIWRRLHLLCRSFVMGPVTTLTFEAIDTAMRDARGKRLGVLLSQLAAPERPRCGSS